ncbi:MAG: 4-hydroxy-tetrahydrodipicolinate synthase [Streptococcaceae bacterium]|jgi:4-hydroxy-tetrahydrodipicolinate synthase|nr:4-hydroxy-tetrahydrodipicolinate synthase [Streptococcaceae bacterium]
MKIKGIITAMVTPLNEDGINEQATRKLVEHLIGQGIHGLFILGTNGEFFSLTDDEKITLTKIVVDQTKGRVPIFAGAGGISTKGVIDLIHRFEAIGGIDAVSVITPYLLKFTDEELISHYQTIAQNTALPIILYNIPANTGINIDEKVFSQLVETPSIIAIKDSSGNLENFEKYLKINQREDFSLLMGSDSKIARAVQMGADGAVASTSNVLAKTDVAIYELAVAGKMDEAYQLQETIDDFRNICKIGTVPSGLKACLRTIGFEVGQPKLPILDVSAETKEKIRQVLLQYEESEGLSILK